MQLRYWAQLVLITSFVSLIGYTSFSTLSAQNGTDTYLPYVSSGQGSSTESTPTGSRTEIPEPGETNTPTSVPTSASTSAATAASTATQASTPTPTVTPTAASATISNDQWNPPATATATATPIRTYPDWVPGTYNVRQYKSEAWAEYRADGTFSERHATFGAADSTTAEGTWFVIEEAGFEQLVVEYTDQDGVAKMRRYVVEQVDDDGFRLAAGDAKVYSFLYERVTPVVALDGENVSRWVQGRWSVTIFLDFNSFFFAEDGTYEMYKIYSFAEPEGAPDETGQWSAWADKMIIQPDGESLENSTYAITSATDGFLQLEGGRFGDGNGGFLRQTFSPSESLSAFEGQYSAGDVTLTVEKEGDDAYSATILDDGNTITATGTVDESNRLVLSTAERTYDPMLPYFNALYQDGFRLPKWLYKMSSTALPRPMGLLGMWVNASSSSGSERWFLPNGRYVSKFSSLQSEGTYTVSDEAITWDPDCGSPSASEYILTDNQLVFPDSSATLTFHYVPLKLPDLIASIAARDEQEAITNFEFSTDTAPLGVRETDFIEPAFGEITVDSNRADVFEDPVVFDGQQLYTWPQEIIYYLNTSGSLVPVNPAYCAFGSCSDLDFTQGWQDKFHYWFFPNGRVQYYHESFLNAVSTSPPTPSITRSWGKYKIEDETITILSDLGETLTFNMTIGRRRALFNEICFENFEWTSDDGAASR